MRSAATNMRHRQAQSADTRQVPGGREEESKLLPKATQEDLREGNEQKFVTDTSIGRLLVTVTNLGQRLYARSGERPRSFFLQTLLLILLLGCNTAVSLWFSYALRAFTTALQEKKEEAFWAAMWYIMQVIAVMVPAHAGKRYAAGQLSLFLRQRFTTALFRDFFSNRNYFAIEVPNASLRLVEVEGWVEEIQTLGMTVLQSLLDLLAFSSLMFFLSMQLFGALATYSFIGTSVSVWFFFPRITAMIADVTSKRAEVTHALVRVHENRESIAFYDGGARENSMLSARLETFISAVRRQLYWGIGLEAFQEAYSYATIVLPYLVVAPLYFAGEVPYGVVSQSSMAFSRIKGAMNLLVSNFSGMATIAASTRRLRELLDAMDHIPPQITNESASADSASDFVLQVDSLQLHTPPPAAQLLCRDLSLALRPGDSILIMGRSGGGKSSLLRCFAHLWDPTSGSVTFGCSKADLHFIPQQPYLPIGTLRDVLMYPKEPSSNEDSHLSFMLQKAGLPHLITQVGGLDAECRWTEMLSHGEQQRIAFARLFLQVPVCVLLDEATSALDARAEESLYRHLCELKPKPTIVSVGHRESLRQFHRSMLCLRDDDCGTWEFSVLP